MSDDQLPERLTQLHLGEEELRRRACALVQKSPLLRTHLGVIESAMDIMDVLRMAGKNDDDDEVVQALGIRVFNDLASSLKLSLSGYSQTAAMILRDVLETVFLIDYFRGERSAISKWRLANPSTRWKLFSPVKVRGHLDKRDGFTGQKRDAAYRLLSTLAAHPTMEGMAMLKPAGMKVHMGPFIDELTLEAVLAETAKLAVQAGELIRDFLPPDEPIVVKSYQAFLMSKNRWFMAHGDPATAS